MSRKILIFSLILFFSLGIFGEALALTNPTNPKVCTGCTQYPDGECRGEGYAKLCWEWSNGTGIIKQFKILFREKDSDTWTARYPDMSNRDYILGGLMENTTYQWRIKAEAVNPADDSYFADGEEFITRAGTTNGGTTDGDTTDGDNTGPIGLVNPLKAKTLKEALDALINFLFFLAMALAPILIIYAAFLTLTAAGDAVKINKAKQIILWTLVAVAIVLLAKGLPSVIKGAFGG